MSNKPVHIAPELLKRLHEYLVHVQDAARIGAHDLAKDGIEIDGWTTLIKSMANLQTQVKKLVAPTHPVHKLDMNKLSHDGKPVKLRGNREEIKGLAKRGLAKRTKRPE